MSSDLSGRAMDAGTITIFGACWIGLHKSLEQSAYCLHIFFCLCLYNDGLLDIAEYFKSLWKNSEKLYSEKTFGKCFMCDFPCLIGHAFCCWKANTKRSSGNVLRKRFLKCTSLNPRWVQKNYRVNIYRHCILQRFLLHVTMKQCFSNSQPRFELRWRYWI